jgi:hypothetical protein
MLVSSQCMNVGFDVASLRAGGFDEYELVKSGLFTGSQLRSVGCDVQRIALMALFEATDGKHWRNKHNWGSVSHPIAQWHGVHLDGSGHIAKIDLRSNFLKGAFYDWFIIFVFCSDIFSCLYSCLLLLFYLLILMFIYSFYYLFKIHV